MPFSLTAGCRKETGAGQGPAHLDIAPRVKDTVVCRETTDSKPQTRVRAVPRYYFENGPVTSLTRPASWDTLSPQEGEAVIRLFSQSLVHTQGTLRHAERRRLGR
jgi:hypothetical protein